MKRYWKILEWIAYAIIALIAVLLVWSILPVKNGPKILSVLSGSMEPAIHTGSVVVIKPESQYKIGDVVTFGKDTKKEVPTTHRIVNSRVLDGVVLFSTKGDANNSTDSMEVKQSDIHGKVLFSVPFAGYIIDFVRKPVGLILVVVLPALYVIYDEIRKIFAEIGKMKRKANNDLINSSNKDLK
jgi:signal peptidase